MPNISISGEHPTRLHYVDSDGPGRPIILIHGWPASEKSWRSVGAALQEAGHRVVAYDRRGFGESEHAPAGYDYDTFAADLDALLDGLDVVDAVLVGFSMGGGEVARYIANHGSNRITGAVFVAAIPPALDATLPDNPGGAFTPDAAAGMQQGLRADPEGFLRQFLTNFHSVPGDDGQLELLASAQQLDEAVAVGLQADLAGLSECIALWLTDFRADLAKLRVPALVIHGDGDQIVPLAASGARMPQFVPQSELVVIEGGPHGLLATHPDQVAAALLDFLG